MRYSASIAAALMICGALSAQNVVWYSGSTQFTSRGNLGAGAGEILQGVHDSHWRALGEATVKPTGKITAFRGVFQDQDITTAEKYKWVVRSGMGSSGPKTGPTGEILVTGDATMPTGASGAGAYILTTALTTPVEVPADKFFSVGVRLPAQSKWPTDGQSCHSQSAVGNYVAGDTIPATFVDMAWQIVGSAATASNPGSKRSWRMGFVQKADSLQLGRFRGTSSINYSHTAHFPIKGKDGLALNVAAAGKNGQIVVLFVSDAFGPLLPIFGGKWALKIGAPLPELLTSGVVAANAFTAKISVIPAALKGDFTFQGAIFDLKKMTGALTNAVKLSL